MPWGNMMYDQQEFWTGIILGFGGVGGNNACRVLLSAAEHSESERFLEQNGEQSREYGEKSRGYGQTTGRDLN